MIDLLLHSGSGHPELAWIGIASVVALVLGLAIGLFSDHIRAWFRTDSADAPDRQ